ncbi:hypothetical protein [uncultured Psychrobacter sp.]|nr:hypothetical protein [uncultured Psychrobacter sp.]
MATIEQTDTPILNSNAQVLILPVNSAGILPSINALQDALS